MRDASPLSSRGRHVCAHTGQGWGGRRAPHLLLCAFAGEMVRDVLPSHIRIASQHWRWAHDGSGVGRETRPETTGWRILGCARNTHRGGIGNHQITTSDTNTPMGPTRTHARTLCLVRRDFPVRVLRELAPCLCMHCLPRLRLLSSSSSS